MDISFEVISIEKFINEYIKNKYYFKNKNIASAYINDVLGIESKTEIFQKTYISTMPKVRYAIKILEKQGKIRKYNKVQYVKI